MAEEIWMNGDTNFKGEISHLSPSTKLRDSLKVKLPGSNDPRVWGYSVDGERKGPGGADTDKHNYPTETVLRCQWVWCTVGNCGETDIYETLGQDFARH
ncbi:Hypothetical protein NTJ_05182 [Nesidiocoris tenuis]|uniref:Uncharacterized protein n=1 Tax=Nesidiocoris tenuis TaxID=355587 RepID=A0ABN7AJY6_9HEMI|nr:Hypothetical protein NTJ_05182 [Nesidiocoris tenuis]